MDFYKAFILLETSNLTEKEIKEELDLKFPFFKSRSDYNTMFEYWKAKYCPYLLTKEQQEHYVQICTEHIKSGLKLSDFQKQHSYSTKDCYKARLFCFYRPKKWLTDFENEHSIVRTPLKVTLHSIIAQTFKTQPEEHSNAVRCEVDVTTVDKLVTAKSKPGPSLKENASYEKITVKIGKLELSWYSKNADSSALKLISAITEELL